MNRHIVLFLLLFLMCGVGISAGLPNNIQNLEYIESSGREWIDTGFSPTIDTRIEAKLRPLDCCGAWHAFFGVWAGDGASLCFRYNGQSKDVNSIFCGYSGNLTFNDMANKELMLSIRYESVTLNGETRTFTPNGRPKENMSLYVFGNHTNKGATGLQAMQLYYLRIFDKRDLVRDFIPVKSGDGKLGLWDKVEGRFYPNEGAGEFIGKEVLRTVSKSSAPTKEEISAAKKSMAALMSTDMEPDALLKLATEATRSGEKYHLYRQSFIGFAKKGDVVSAIDVLDQYIAAFTNLPDEELLSLLTSKSASSIRKAPEIANRVKILNIKVSAAKQLKSSKQALKKAPRNTELQCRIGEAEVSLGNWKSALSAFEKAEGKIVKIAKDESIKVNLFECANFWWDYEPATKATLKEFYRAHASDLYQEALDIGKLSVVEKTVAEKRISAAEYIGDDSAGGMMNPKNELLALKKICDTRGLIHCWRFNGDLRDCVGEDNASCWGNAKLDDCKTVSIFGGNANNNIWLGKGIVPNDGSSVTIEIWAMQKEPQYWSRILSFGRSKNQFVDISWSELTDIQKMHFLVKDGCWDCKQHIAPFELGNEYHIAFVFSPIDEHNWVIKAYKQDVVTGRTIANTVVPLKKGWSLKGFANDQFHLGTSYNNPKGDAAPSASYNEVRVWKRALSEGELTDNAKRFYKAGETMKK